MIVFALDVEKEIIFVLEDKCTKILRKTYYAQLHSHQFLSGNVTLGLILYNCQLAKGKLRLFFQLLPRN